MQGIRRASAKRLSVSVGALAAALLLGTAVHAQTTTSTIRGQAPAGVEVTARNTATGAVVRATVGPDGDYALAGLQPGTYEIAAGDVPAQTVTIQVGQTAELDLTAPAEEAVAGEVVVTAAPRTLVEVKTSEVATNVSQEQIRSLPQSDRNFLSFAQLAPGIQYNDSETERTFRGGAQGQQAVNVFIDGATLKNQINDSGIVGQDDSRGNPFPQLAVREFRVITQNFKAEYEQAASSIITAVTRSGSNRFEGEGFFSFQNTDLVARTEFQEREDEEKPDYRRLQFGAGLGGPIVRDRLFFFGSYEGNYQDRSRRVTLGNSNFRNTTIPFRGGTFGQFEGEFPSEFREDLLFGKLTWLVSDEARLDLSATYRTETDVRSFGGDRAQEAGEDLRNDNTSVILKHTYRGEGFVNEFTADYLRAVYNPTSQNPDQPSFVFENILTVGGREASQRRVQSGFTFRDDLVLTEVEAYGNHVIKGGAKVSFQNYEVNNFFFTTPQFRFRRDPTQNLDIDIPFEASLGLGNPRIEDQNTIYGFFIQDDWEVNDNLTLNLGIRYDYETNPLNNDYVTPDAARRALLSLPTTSYFNPQDYITDGDDREPFRNAFQPRLGFSYDLFADQRTVIFGGYGKYFDRVLFNEGLDERFRLQYQIGVFRFSRTGLPRDGFPTVRFDPSFLTREGLLRLRASGQTGLPELFAINNETTPPNSDQFNLGIRQTFDLFGDRFITSLTYSRINSHNGFTYLFATRNPDGTCCNTASVNREGFSNVLISSDARETKSDAVYVQVEKPFTEASRYGLTFSYTFTDAVQNGGDLFSLDFPSVEDYPFYPVGGLDRHRIVFSGIVGLPYDFRLSTLVQLGSGHPFTIDDFSRGFGPNQANIRRNEGEPPREDFLIPEAFNFRQVDLRLEKIIEIFTGQEIAFSIDAFNVFNFDNFSCYNGFIPPLPEVNPNFGQPSCLRGNPRAFQLNARYRF